MILDGISDYGAHFKGVFVIFELPTVLIPLEKKSPPKKATADKIDS